MTTFDLVEVRGFAANLDERIQQCDNGEGMECSNLDDTLRHYAALCCEFREAAVNFLRESLSVSRYRIVPRWGGATLRACSHSGHRLWMTPPHPSPPNRSPGSAGLSVTRPS
jgi:hypothetical protein